MSEQTGARWLAREKHGLGAEDTNAPGVTGGDGGPTKQDVKPPPSFTFFDCIRQDRYTESVTALISLGFKVHGATAPRGGDRREESGKAG